MLKILVNRFLLKDFTKNVLCGKGLLSKAEASVN